MPDALSIDIHHATVSTTCYSPPPRHTVHPVRSSVSISSISSTSPSTRLFSERPRPSSGSVSADGKAQKASFYKRPSKAIEMGGGFFIPGLEGYRLRLFTAVLVFALIVLNRFPGYDPSQSQVISEAIGVGAAVVLLAQVKRERGGGSKGRGMHASVLCHAASDID